MKSLKSAGIISAAALSALALASCSAGQITQTSSQVAAVDGASADSEDGTVAVRDVTVVVNEEGDAALKFTAINQDPSMTEHTLDSVEVDGAAVEMDSATLGRDCVLVGDSAEGLDSMPQAENTGCIEYTETSLPNDDFAIGGNLPVVFSFDTGEVEVTATIAAPQLTPGTFVRDSVPEAH